MAVRFDADGEDYTRATTFGLGTYTITCWVRIDVDLNTFSTAHSIHDGTLSGFSLVTSADGVTWQMSDTQSGNTSLFAATVGTWYYIALAKDPNASGTNAFWAAADTLALSTTTGTHAESGSGSIVRIGESLNGGEWLNGSIAAVKIWSGVKLTQAEIENERFQYLPHRTANLFAFYPFLEGGTGAGALQDFSGSGNTLSNGTGSATTDGPPIPWWGIKSKFSTFVVGSTPDPGGFWQLEENTDRWQLEEDGSGLWLLEETQGDLKYPAGYIHIPQNTLIRL
jgi:concanavalin A-like lectin/glucanase superfamily protein